VVVPYRTKLDKSTGKRVAVDVDSLRGTTPVKTKATRLHYRKRSGPDGVLVAGIGGYGLVPSVAKKVLQAYGRVLSLRLRRLEVKCFPVAEVAHIRPPSISGPTLFVTTDREHTLRQYWGGRVHDYDVRCYELSFTGYSRSWGVNLEAVWKGDADVTQFDSIALKAMGVLDELRDGVELRPVANVCNKRCKRPYGTTIAAKSKRCNSEGQAASEKAWEHLNKWGRIANPELAALFGYAGERRWQRANDFARRNGLERTKDAKETVLWLLPG